MRKFGLNLFMLLVLTGCAQAVPPVAPPVPYRPRPTPTPTPEKRGNYAEINSDSEYTVYKQKHKDSPVCEYFFATWCGPCQQFGPIYKKVASEQKHVLFVKIDVDRCPQAGRMNQVKSLPTILIKGERFVGGQNEQEFTNRVLKFFPK